MEQYVRMKNAQGREFSLVSGTEEKVIPVEPFGNVSFRKLKNIPMVEIKNTFIWKNHFCLPVVAYTYITVSTVKISPVLMSLPISRKGPMIVLLGKKDRLPVIVSTFPMAVCWAVISHPFHPIAKQHLFYKHFLSIFNVPGLGQEFGNTLISKKWALTECRRGEIFYIWYIN